MKKRDDGRWQERVSLGRDPATGRYKYKYLYGATKKEVTEKVAEFQADLHIYGRPVDNTNVTLAEWGHTYLFTVAKPRIEKSTFANYMSFYNIHIKDDFLGEMAVKDIQPIHLQNFFNDKRRLSKGTIKGIKKVLKLMFDSAIDNSLIRISPLQRLKLPVSEVKEKGIEVFTIEEQKAYMEAIKQSTYYMLFLTALYTGMRQGELIALKWQNVDLQNCTINICESYKRVIDYKEDGTTEIYLNKKEPKTESGTRIIPIAPFLAQKLKEYKKTSVTNIENLVFCTRKGSPCDPRTLRRSHYLRCRRAGIRETPFHSLRHTFATRAIENGMDVKTVSQILGHKDVMITLRTYVHSTEKSRKQVADMMDKLYQSLTK